MIRLPHTGWFVLLTLAVLAGCRRPDPSLSSASKRPADPTGLASDWADKRRQGIDFVATGGTRTAIWRLDVDFSKQMRLETFDGPDLLMPIPKPQPNRRGSGVVLDSRAAPLQASSRRGVSSTRSTTGRNRLVVSIEPTSWRDPVTKRDYAYTVRVEANGKAYLGGGSFIKAGNRLNGAWVVETYKGQRLRPEQFGDKTLPFLEIDLSKGKLGGYTGWSKLKGDIQTNGDQLFISPKTTQHQPQAGSFEAGFLESLRQSTLFRVGKDRLTLLVNGQYVMTLRKA